jgi:hypothetical protein
LRAGGSPCAGVPAASACGHRVRQTGRMEEPVARMQRPAPPPTRHVSPRPPEAPE